MKYNEFKNHIYKRLRNEFGFQKEGKMHVYRNDEVKIIINTQKSDYANDSYVHVGINPKDVLEHWNLNEPLTTESSRIHRPLVGGKGLYELDSFDLGDIDKDLDNFFENIFPNLLSIEKLKLFYENKQDDLMPYLREFWYSNEE